MESLRLDGDWLIPAGDLSVRFVRSSGPGGQNVNKVATKVELRFEFDRTEALSSGQKLRLAARYPSQITREGQLVLTGDEHRSQVMNLEAVRARLREMILAVRRPPRVRRTTKPTRAAKQRRLDEKRYRARVKSQRTGRFD